MCTRCPQSHHLSSTCNLESLPEGAFRAIFQKCPHQICRCSRQQGIELRNPYTPHRSRRHATTGCRAGSTRGRRLRACGCLRHRRFAYEGSGRVPASQTIESTCLEARRRAGRQRLAATARYQSSKRLAYPSRSMMRNASSKSRRSSMHSSISSTADPCHPAPVPPTTCMLPAAPPVFTRSTSHTR